MYTMTLLGSDKGKHMYQLARPASGPATDRSACWRVLYFVQIAWSVQRSSRYGYRMQISCYRLPDTGGLRQTRAV